MKIPHLNNGFLIQANTENQNTYQIFLYGIVGWQINVEMFFQELKKIPASVDTIEFYLNSPGGLVYEGFALLTNISRLRKQYNTIGYIDGMAGSMMSAIAVSFDKTFASPTSTMVIHDPMANLDIYGNYNKKNLQDLIEDLQSIYEGLEVDSEVIAYPYAQKTGMDNDQVAKLWLDDGKDHVLSPTMMLEIGLIDGISEQELPKPDNFSEEEEGDWLASEIAKINSGDRKQPEIEGYRGLFEKTFATFVDKQKNSDNKPSSSQHSPTKNKENMKFSKIALAVGLDPMAELDSILATITDLQEKSSKVAKLEKDYNDAQSLIDTFKSAQTKNEATIQTLQEELVSSKTSVVVDEVISTVASKAEGMEVNKKIRPQLEALAKDHLQAESTGDEKVAKNAKDHMELLAKTSLVPIGKNPDLSDDGSQSRVDTGGLSLDALKKAMEEGKKVGQKETSRYKTVNA